MIVAGVVIGPYGFNVLDNDSSFAIFGQVGLLYLMFLAGLEIDMYHLKLNLRRGLLFGLLTLLVPLGLGIVTSYCLLHLDLLTSMLLGAMYASHTLIAYPVAARFGITKAPEVLIAIVGTIIAVIGALLVLAATVNISREGAFYPSEILLLLGRLAIWCLAILYAYPRLTRIFFKKYPDKVMQYVYIMAMVFLAAWTAQLIGLEAVLGAFFAGLVLNRYVPAASPLMSSIEFVGNALFIPYFLISVGMMINIRVITDSSTLAVAGIMLAVALVSKWLPAYIVQRINGFTAAGRNVMFGLTTAHTAVALAVVTLGFNLHMFDSRILNSTVLVILVTCALAPVLTSASAPKLKIAMLDKEDDADSILRRNRHNNTLIPVANPITAQSLVEMALLMQNTRGRHDIYALHVRSDNSQASKAISENSLSEARKAGAAVDVDIHTLERYDLNIVTGILNAIEEREITEVILVRALARLTRQVGCRIIFCCNGDIQPLIRGVLYQENYGIRCEFRTVEDWDDFILLGNRVLDDDLFVLIGARANSVSYSAEMVELPSFLQKYFSRNNLMVIYPEQFGAEVALTSFTDPLSSDISSTASPLWMRLRSRWRKLVNAKRRFTHRNRKPKY